jgi:uncharacterized glyoxalase superfamily protein PhnB
MRTNRSIPPAAVIPVLTYPDVRAAVAWLEAALGMVERTRVGADHRAQLSAGDGALIVADAEEDRRGPQAGAHCHSVMLRVDDVAAACARAVQAGAAVAREPTEFPFGERQCTLVDPWGHRWTLSQTVADVAPEDWGGAAIVPWPASGEK